MAKKALSKPTRKQSTATARKSKRRSAASTARAKSAVSRQVVTPALEPRTATDHAKKSPSPQHARLSTKQTAAGATSAGISSSPPSGWAAPKKAPKHVATAASANAPHQVPRNINDAEITVDGGAVKLTNLQKVFWPELGLTKRDFCCNIISPSRPGFCRTFKIAPW